MKSKQIEEIKLRKDIQILNDKYNISILAMSKHFNLSTERTLREFLVMGRTLKPSNFNLIKAGVQDLIQQVESANQYKGFEGGSDD